MGSGKSKLGHNKSSKYSKKKGSSPYTRDTENQTEPVQELISRDYGRDNLTSFDMLSIRKRDETIDVRKGLSEFVVYEPLDDILEAEHLAKFRIFTSASNEAAVIVSWKEGNFHRMVNSYKLKQTTPGCFEGYVPIIGELVELVVPTPESKGHGNNHQYRCLTTWRVTPNITKNHKRQKENLDDKVRFNEDFSPISNTFPDINCHNARLYRLTFKVERCVTNIIANVSHPCDPQQNFPYNVFVQRSNGDEKVTVFLTFTDEMPSSVLLSLEAPTLQQSRHFSPTKPKRGMTDDRVATYLLTNFARTTSNARFPVISNHSLEDCLMHPLAGTLQAGSSVQFQIKSRTIGIVNSKVWYVETGGNFFKLQLDDDGFHSGLVQIGLDGAKLGYIQPSHPEGGFYTYAVYDAKRNDRMNTENSSSYMTFSVRNTLEFTNSYNTDCFEELCGDMFVLEEECGFDHLKLDDNCAPFANGVKMKKPTFPLIDILGADKVSCRFELPHGLTISSLALEDSKKQRHETMIKWKQTRDRLHLTSYFPYEGDYQILINFDNYDREDLWSEHMNHGQIRLTVLGTGAFFRSVTKFPQVQYLEVGIAYNSHQRIRIRVITFKTRN